jgi:TolB protein
MIKKLARVTAALTLLASSLIVIPPTKAFAVQQERLVYTNSSNNIVSIKPDGTDFQQITAGFYPNISPDQSKIAVVKNSIPGTDDVYTVNIDGTNEVKVTNTSGSYKMIYSVAWSPDGSKLAFSRNALPDQEPLANKDIYIINADGTNETNITNDLGAATNIMPSWSPDGSKIIYATIDGIHTMNPDGSDDQLLISGASDPQWSPDGTKISYKIGGNVYVAGADGSNAISFGNANLETWSPDSSQLALAVNCNCGRPATIKVVQSDNTNPINIYTPNRGGAVQSISWSPSGTEIAFSGSFPNGDEPAYTIYTANPSEATVTGVYNDPLGSQNVRWIGSSDNTPPTVSSFTLTRKTSSQTENFTVAATDDNSGVASGEFYYGNDPGQGNGTSMTYANGQLSGILGTDMPVGTYQVYVRAIDNAGNWSTPVSAKLVVTETGTTRVTASGSFTPSVANGDQLPSLDTASFKLAQYNQNVSFGNNGIVSSSSANFTYTYGSTVLCGLLPFLPQCHQMTFSATGASITSLVFSGTNRSQATVTGTAQVTVDGVTTTNPFEITAISSARAGSGSNSYKINIYTAGTSIAPENLLYTASNTGTVAIN